MEIGRITQLTNNVMPLPIPTFTKQQRFCIAKHLQGFFQLTVNEDQYFILPCRVCKYAISHCSGIVRQEWMNIISKQTGVALSFFKGFKTEELPEGLRVDTPRG